MPKVFSIAFFLVLVFLARPFQVYSERIDGHIDKVNLFIGTAGDYGQMSPGATVPFGMIQVAPDSDPRQHSGYDYAEPTISGFSINRLSGVGCSGCGGNVSLLPISGGRRGDVPEKVLLMKHTEVATPGFYSVTLDNGVTVRATATQHMAIEEFVFEESRGALLVDPASSFNKVLEFDFRALSATMAQGYIVSRNTCNSGRYHLHYRLYTSVPFRVEEVEGRKKLLVFDDMKSGGVEVRIVVSTGMADALDRVEEMMVWHESFDIIKQKAESAWSELLGTISVRGETTDMQTLFYTSLYRVFHSPFQVTDETFDTFLGTDGEVHSVPFTYYNSWSLWDTYRTKFPLIALLQPERASDIMQSLSTLYVTGKKSWSTVSECVPSVRTEHAAIALLDAYRKGIRIPNLREAYSGMTEEILRLPLEQPDKCLEVAGDFWALGQIAKELGYAADASRWTIRGETIFDSIWPNVFMSIDNTFVQMGNNGLYQGTKWQYRWGAPMYLDRMIRLEGKRRLFRELNAFFAKGLYNQGNEPDIHAPFLFGRLGHPRKTGDIVRQLSCDEMIHRYGGNDAYPEPFVGCAFNNAPRGYCPEMDDDDGTMSAWYVFSSLGMYPTIVGEAAYDLFSPLFEDITIHLSGGKLLVIRTDGRKSATQRIKKVMWNGKKLKDFRIEHQQIMDGGELVFVY